MAKIKDGFRGSRAIVLPASVIAGIDEDPFASKLYITDIGYYPHARHHYRARREASGQYVLIYCVDGRGWFEVGGRTHNIAANQLFILPRGIPHAYGADPHDPWTIYWLHFNGEMAPFYAEGHDEPTSIPPNDESRIMDRLSLFEDIFRVLENGYSRENIHYACSCLYHFLGSVKYIGKFRESAGRQEHSKDVVERAIAYMKEHIEKNLPVEELCAYLGYSSSYFSNLFRSRTGYSPKSYMLQLKVQAACRLLDFTDMKINQVCHKVGFADPYHFTKMFTRQMGSSPIKYRNKAKG